MNTSTTGDTSKLLDKVRKLIAKAEDCENPDSTAYNLAEGQAYRTMADGLILKYAIDEAMLNESRPEAERTRPTSLDFPLINDDDLLGWLTSIIGRLARFTRTRVRNYTHFDKDQHVWMSRVYGFESDVRYFEFLYTTMRLHMFDALRPKVDPALSLEDNAYNFHEAGYNWLEIAQAYGWYKVSNAKKGLPTPYQIVRDARDHHPEAPWYDDSVTLYYQPSTHEIGPATQVGSHFKRAYHRAVKARGETPKIINASSSETYRNSAAQGYFNTLARMMQRTERDRGTGTDVILANYAEQVEAYFREMNKDLYPDRPANYEPPKPCEKCAKNKSGSCRDHPLGRTPRAPAFSSAGYDRGSAHARTFDLTGGRGMKHTREVES